MFSTYIYDEFPLVKVVFEEGPKTMEDFEEFTNGWLDLYEKREMFTFLFDTTKMKDPAYKYAIKMSQFIRELKKKETQYLDKSVILINNNKIKYLLDAIFAIQKPVAPVYIYNINNDDIINENNINHIINHKDTLLISP
jgi:hypothetical protein